MGRRAHHPRRGSLGYSPRKMAARPLGHVRTKVKEDQVRMQGFCGFKAGITHLTIIDDYKNSITRGEEITTAATIIEVPPMTVCGLRAYGESLHGHGLKILKEVWANDFSKDLKRAFPVPESFSSKLEDIEKIIDDVKELRLIVHTNPRRSSVSQKKPETMECHISGSEIKEAFEYAKTIFGKEIKISDVFKEGEFIDTISITKGKGFQGPLKKWGTKHLPRKTRKGHRTAGTLGPWHPAAMMWSVPQSGQMGYHQRTELNKRILKIGTDGRDVNPDGGFLKYGSVRSDYVIVSGSVAGPRKRHIKLRPAIRPPRKILEGNLQVTYISKKSKQGV